MANPAQAARAEVKNPADRIVRFFERRLRHTKDDFRGLPFTLEPWQEHEILRPIFGTVRADGTRKYREVLLGIARKNGKSELAAGMGLYGTFADGYYNKQGLWVPLMGGETYVVAGSKGQARGLFDVAQKMVLMDPYLRAAAKVYKDSIVFPERDNKFQVLAADAKLQHGLNPSMAILDELWVHPSDEQYEAFNTAGGARKQPLLIAITTAGIVQGEHIAYKLYQHGKKGGSRGRFFFFWAEASKRSRIDDPKAWRQANPASWRKASEIRAQLPGRSPSMTEFSFRRLYLNQWVTSSEQVIPLDRWDKGKAKPKFTPGDDVMIGVDVAPRGKDRTAISLVRRDDQRTYHTRLTLFEPDPDLGMVDYQLIENLIRDYAETFNVLEVAYDPYYFDRSALILEGEGIPMTMFKQDDARMVPASQGFYQVVMEGRIRHGGDPILREHVEAAGAKETSRGWRFHKAKSSGRIDGVIATLMAIDRFERGEPAPTVGFTTLDDYDDVGDE